MNGNKEIRGTLKRLRTDAALRGTRNQQIVGRLLNHSDSVTTENFTDLSDEDIRLLFEAYDELYFEGTLSRATGKVPLEFRVSSRMTRAGGKTSAWRKHRDAPIERLEIVVSSTLLLQTFCEESEREVTVTGILCRHRTDALLRVMEHELIHLAELLGWNDSSCRCNRFQQFAWQIFGHTDHRHALMTPREHASSLGVFAGATVEFEISGRRLRGIVNRVTRRATVLVLSDGGQLFNDGHRYEKYYVPVGSLSVVDA